MAEELLYVVLGMFIGVLLAMACYEFMGSGK